MTTSPLAILVPLARISRGSPASLSNSTTDPSFNLKRSFIAISVFPTSTVNLTSIFSSTLRLFTADELGSTDLFRFCLSYFLLQLVDPLF